MKIIIIPLACTMFSFSLVVQSRLSKALNLIKKLANQTMLKRLAFLEGVEGNGVSEQTNLPDNLSLDKGSLLWSHEIQGGGVPVIAGGKVYQFGYYGVEDDLQEALVCFDATTGDILWERLHSDFISDIVYNRYGVGAACIDPASGNVYFRQVRLIIGYDSDGNVIWERSLWKVCNLTFSNGHTGGPCGDGDLVIIHAITANGVNRAS